MEIEKQVNDKLQEAWAYLDPSPHEAYQTAQATRRLSLTLNSLNGVAAAQIIEGHALWRLSKYEDAITVLDSAQVALDKYPYGQWHFRLHSAYGNIFRDLGAFDKAFKHYYKMGEIAQAMDDEKRKMHVEGNLGALYGDRGDYERAITHFDKILNYSKVHNNRNWEFITYYNKSFIYKSLGDLDKSLEMAEAAQTVMSDETHEQFSVHELLANIYTIKGLYSKALKNLEILSHLNIVNNLDFNRLDTVLAWADYYIAIEQNDEATTLLSEALTLAINIQAEKYILSLHTRLFKVYQRQEMFEKALYHHIEIRNIEKKRFSDASDERIRNLEIVYQMNKLQEDFQRQQQEHATILEMKDALLSAVSHDLKNPLSSIRTTVYLANKTAESNGDTNHAYQRFFDKISTQTDRMTQLITDVLDIARLDLSINLPMEIVDIQQIIHETQVNIQHRLRSKDIHLSYQPSYDEHVHIVAHRSSMLRVFENLLDNAIKYSPKNSIIVIEQNVIAGEKLSIKFIDTGYGIPSNELPKIFNKFFRGSAERGSEEGTGLGLAIVKNIVEQHHGAIRAESVLGKGTTFELQFPISHKPNISEGVK